MDSGSSVSVDSKHDVTDAEWKVLCKFACGFCKNLLYCSECGKFHCGFGRKTLSLVRCKRFVFNSLCNDRAPWESSDEFSERYWLNHYGMRSGGLDG